MSENQYRDGNGEIKCFHYFAKGNSIWYCIHCGYEEEL